MNDPRYVKWIAQLYSWEDLEYKYNVLPVHKCTEFLYVPCNYVNPNDANDTVHEECNPDLEA